ncbi:DUF6941 family protein [Pseudomonas sp. A-RE-19]|uniref:DUF6941 family protein n=1 Tax=Pseudomonas sp. A-RE-19 TaxID=2832401 RepID=UPI001CBC60DA|nr:hypothetical protein [Pseudomonas sp. A-RE-19]
MSRFAYSIFCDDIRHEVNGKTSLMGVYQGSLLLQEFPAMLPKLCVVMHVVSHRDNLVKNITFKGILDDSEIFAITLDEAQLQAGAEMAVDLPNIQTKQIQAIGLLTPITFEKPCSLKILIEADGEPIDCAGLEIMEAPSGMQIIS